MAYITIYIKNKKIKTSNNIKDFKDIGKVAWKLISFIYKSKWNSLITDNYKNSFRQKVTYKFTSKVNLEKNSKKRENIINKPISIKQLPSLIPAKFLNKGW